MTREEIVEFIEQYIGDQTEDILLADGFEAAFIGLSFQFNRPTACYDYAKCISVLVAEGMTEEDAIEHMSYNVEGSYVGEYTPTFLRRI